MPSVMYSDVHCTHKYLHHHHHHFNKLAPSSNHSGPSISSVHTQFILTGVQNIKYLFDANEENSNHSSVLILAFMNNSTYFERNKKENLLKTINVCFYFVLLIWLKRETFIATVNCPFRIGNHVNRDHTILATVVKTDETMIATETFLNGESLENKILMYIYNKIKSIK
uniref:Uncharacterized protein n=1 Tax=Glossina pallidipes TaxID=7398 RepID=A0A1B0AEK3_GLOPL